MRYFTRKLESVSDILWMIVGRSLSVFYVFSLHSMFCIRCCFKRLKNIWLMIWLGVFLLFFSHFIKTICENIRIVLLKTCLQRVWDFLKSFINKVSIKKKNAKQSQRKNWLQRFKKYKYNKQLYCETLVLASYCCGGNNA